MNIPLARRLRRLRFATFVSAVSALVLAPLASAPLASADPPYGPGGPGGPGPADAAPAADPAQPALLTAAELEDLVAPVALYPDVVLDALLPATAMPLDVVAAARHVQASGGSAQAAPEGVAWDPAVVAMLQYPDVLRWMSENLPWLERMGLAMTVQPEDVLAAVQRYRARAQRTGALASNEQVTVVVEETPAACIRILPVRFDVVYVPVYDPWVVFEPTYVFVPTRPFFTFWLGFWCGPYGPWSQHEIAWGWDGGHRVYAYEQPWWWGLPRRSTSLSLGASFGPWRPTYAQVRIGRRMADRRAHAGFGFEGRTTRVARPRLPTWTADRTLRGDGATVRHRDARVMPPTRRTTLPGIVPPTTDRRLAPTPTPAPVAPRTRDPRVPSTDPRRLPRTEPRAVPAPTSPPTADPRILRRPRAEPRAIPAPTTPPPPAMNPMNPMNPRTVPAPQPRTNPVPRVSPDRDRGRGRLDGWDRNGSDRRRNGLDGVPRSGAAPGIVPGAPPPRRFSPPPAPPAPEIRRAQPPVVQRSQPPVIQRPQPPRRDPTPDRGNPSRDRRGRDRDRDRDRGD